MGQSRHPQPWGNLYWVGWLLVAKRSAGLLMYRRKWTAMSKCLLCIPAVHSGPRKMRAHGRSKGRIFRWRARDRSSQARIPGRNGLCGERGLSRTGRSGKLAERSSRPGPLKAIAIRHRGSNHCQMEWPPLHPVADRLSRSRSERLVFDSRGTPRILKSQEPFLDMFSEIVLT